jgi:hypothetical protein
MCPLGCSVTPAKAGVQRFSDHVWIPAFAGMTSREQYFGYSIVWRCTNGLSAKLSRAVPKMKTRLKTRYLFAIFAASRETLK